MFDEKEFRRKMISAGMSIKDIANAVGVNEATLYRKIKGVTDFSRNEMVVIRSALHMSTDEFENIFLRRNLRKRKKTIYHNSTTIQTTQKNRKGGRER